MSAPTSTAEWIGAGALGVTAWLLVAAAAYLGAAHAHASANAQLAAYRRRRAAAPVPPPAPAALEFPPIPESPPDEALPAHDRTLQLHQVKENRARHRKEPACS
ncbi:hypothetical protein [Streptomyces sp. NPDC001914]|uniref:hypothetical protein n=1 Tax=Streptomyces sp. NPDC001914 TaxID=3364623 RepID=UPI00369B29EB